MIKSRVQRANETLWRRYEDYGEERGNLAVDLLATAIKLQGAKILDFGAGTGGAALAAAKRGAQVFAVEIDPHKSAVLKSKTAGYSVHLFESLQAAACAAGNFDAAILADVVEHLKDLKGFFLSLSDCLSAGAVVYLSTPNRCSPINLFCDPHYSLPLVSLLKREHVCRIAVRFAGASPQKTDWPQLLSLDELSDLAAEAGFSIRLVHHEAVRYGMRHPQALWNRPMHLRLAFWIKRMRLERLIPALMSDAPNLWNRFMMPAFYLLLQKRPAGISDRP